MLDYFFAFVEVGGRVRVDEFEMRAVSSSCDVKRVGENVIVMTVLRTYRS